jgi:hypothetical protein
MYVELFGDVWYFCGVPTGYLGYETYLQDWALVVIMG